MKTNKVLSFLLVLLLVLSLALPFSAEKNETTAVIACSDFQASSDDVGEAQVRAISLRIAEDYPTVNGFLACGDYTGKLGTATQTRLSETGLRSLIRAVNSVWPDPKDSVFVKGNHDPEDNSLLSLSGPNDPQSGKYGVFVVNESDYCWKQSSVSGAGKKTWELSKILKTYLTEKADAGFRAPIFVLSHLPLHFSERTLNSGDAVNAYYLFEALQEGAARGLNIVYLFGHDHSSGYDNYLGGAAVCLQPGDEIVIARKGQKSASKPQKINFTYLNAGYVGYYSSSDYPAGTVEDTALTMTVFSFDDMSLRISRYDNRGLHKLQSAGNYSLVSNGEEAKLKNVTVDTTEIESPLVLELHTPTPASDTASSSTKKAEKKTEKKSSDKTTDAISSVETSSEKESGFPLWILFAAFGIVLVAAAVAVILFLRGKKKK